MIMSGIEFTKEVPFTDVLFHVMVRDEKGKKMSKSLGNSPEPVELIDKYGSDALRFGLMLITPREQDVLYSEKSIDVGRKFCNKLWNAARLISAGVSGAREFNPDEISVYDAWIIERFNELLGSIEKRFKTFEINTITHELYEFTWHVFCDWYLEFTKIAPPGQTARYVLKRLLIMLHPFMPFITEEIYHRFSFPEKSIMLEKWPEKITTTQSGADVEKIVQLVEGIRNVRGIFNIKANEKLGATVKSDSTTTKAIKENEKILKRLAGIDMIDYNQPIKGSVASIVTPEMECYVRLTGIDIEKEKIRLQKEIDFLSQRIDEIKHRLNNPSYVKKASTETKEREKQRLEGFLKKKEGIQKAMARL
jgi:valyl-tRNA synthetase